MRYLPLLLVLALTACDAAYEPEPVSPTTDHYLMWGPSNAHILGEQGDAALDSTYKVTGRTAYVEATATRGGRWLMQEGDRGDSCGDFSPRSQGECYDMAVDLTREALASISATEAVGGIVWHNGSDQRGIDSLFTQEDYDEEFRALIRAVARDFPGMPFYVIEAGTDYGEEEDASALTRRFRQHEATVCASEPNCHVISAMTDEVLTEARQVCGMVATCIDTNYFDKGGVHWQPRAVEIIMEEAGRVLALIEG